MKQMRRIFSAALAVTVAACVLLSGCGKKEEDTVSYKQYDYDLSEYVKLGEYKGVSVKAYGYSVTDEVVQEQIKMALSNYAKLEEKTDAIANGDQVNIDFTGYMDGEVFEGGSATGHSLTIGTGSFIAGFEEGLIGAKKGETVVLDIAFPDPYTLNPDLSGKPVRFDVKINAVYKQILPEYTDTFVQEYYGYATVAEFEVALRDSIQEQLDSNAWYYTLDQVWTHILETTEILSYPEKEYNEVYNSYLEPYTTAAKNANMTLSQFLELSEGTTEAELYAEVEEIAKSVVKEELIGNYILRQEKLVLEGAAYEEEAQKFATERGFDSVKELLEYNEATDDDLRQTLEFQRLFDFLVDNAVVESDNQ